ncbi:unnamed protein product [Prorocentrum cordatum]|uniref:Uncharacterized protein n=1 Tax=Prorocentrum cordatum TaxID=2364126 RepID=A0ABN9Q5T0_9DINO|nr:unnamed protein product [Polarella glacialis]
MSQLTEAFKTEFQKILNLKKMKANEHMDMLMTCLRAHKLAYAVNGIEPKFVLARSANRGGLLLSPHNVHRNAARIHAAGADMRQLSNAVCIELGVNSPVRWQHVAKNKVLVDRADGLLAPVNGSERYVTVGCGHTTAFCKLAGVQGRTSEKSLQMADSDTIDVQKLSQNAQIKAMIEKGWAWEVVPSIIDELFPGFASVAQKALNTQNHIGTEVGELETCMTLAAIANDPGMRQVADWKAMAIETVVSLNIPSAKYSKTLLEFVENFGGGDGAPLVSFMDSVAKQFGCNATLGQAFWESITNAAFASKTNMYPLIRVALAIANLTGDKVEDGVARLLVKNDVTKVASTPKMAEANTAESILGEAMDIARGLDGIDAALQPLGQLFVRIALKLTGKEKMGREGKELKWGDICVSFLTSLSDLKGQTVTFDEWSKHAVSSGAAAAARAKPSASSTATLSDHKGPTWIAKKAGYSVGCLVVQKDVAAQRLYTIFSIGQTVKLREAINHDASREAHTADITFEDLLQKWSISKAALSKQMDGDQQRPQQLYIDKQKAALYRALLELDAKHVGKHKLTFWRKPDGVWTTSAIKQGQLTLVPVAPLINTSAKNNGSGISLGEHAIDKDTKFDEAALVAAHWWAAPTYDKKQANMATSHVSHGGLTLPVLTNTTDIGPNVKLQMLAKPKAKEVPIHEQAVKKQKRA